MSDSILNDFINQNSFKSEESLKGKANIDEINISLNNKSNTINESIWDNSIYPNNDKNNNNENIPNNISKARKYYFYIIINKYINER